MSEAAKRAKKKHDEKRIQKHISLNLETEKHLIEWFEKNKGQATVLIKQWIEKDMKK